MVEIRHYVNRAGKDIFDDWLTQLADARASEDRHQNQPACSREFRRHQISAAGTARITNRLGTRLPRILRDDWQRESALLLCGGDKRRQAADIERALEYLNDYKKRSGTA